MEKPGCNINYTNGTLAYSNIVQCLFISQNVCTVLITVLSVCVLLISNANIERFLLLSSFFISRAKKALLFVLWYLFLHKKKKSKLDIINQCIHIYWKDNIISVKDGFPEKGQFYSLANRKHYFYSSR